MNLLNRILSAVLALALLLGGSLAVVEIVLAQLGRPSWLVPHEQWSQWLASRGWDDSVVRVILAGLVILGIVLLLLAMRRGKPRLVALPATGGDDASGITLTASRRDVERSLAAAARRTGGVRKASAKVTRRRVKVQAQTTTRSRGDDIASQVTAAVSDRLTDLGLADRLAPRVTLSRKES